MKYFALFLIAALCVVVQSRELSDATAQGIKIVQRICTDRTGADIETIKKFRKGGSEDTPKLREYLLCFLKTSGVMNDSGDFFIDVLEEALTARLGKEVAKKVLEECAVKKTTPLETAYEYSKCNYKYRPEGYSTLE